MTISCGTLSIGAVIQKFISKWISGEDTATGEVMVYRKQRDSSACPHCQQENEDLVHVLSCTNQLVREKHKLF